MKFLNVRTATLAAAVLLSIVSGRFAQASEQEHLSVSELRRASEDLVQRAEADPAARRELNHLFFETKKRVSEMSRYKYLGLSFNDEYFNDLERRLLPQLRDFSSRHGLAFDRAAYEADLRALDAEVALKELSLKAYYAKLSAKHPLLTRVAALTSFARSETLSDGTIGDWNPADSQRIQDSAISGLNSVLDRIQMDVGLPAQVLKRLTEYHALLLGEAQHHFSQPGRLNNITFVSGDGKRTPVGEYLGAWQRDFSAAVPSAMQAHVMATRFLYLHPFGDSNGRIAEVTKQMLLRSAGLPPLLTFEKTAAENYAYQPMFGEGTIQRSVLQQMRDTEAFLKSWENALGPEGVIHDVNISGNNVIARVGTAQGEKILVSTRAYHIGLHDALPPIKGAVVVAERSASDIALRFTQDHWQTVKEVRPSQIARTERLGSIKVSFPLFVIDAPRATTRAGSTFSFAFKYDHPEAGEVWFSNNGRNYNQNWATPTPQVPARSGVMCSAIFLRRAVVPPPSRAVLMTPVPGPLAAPSRALVIAPSRALVPASSRALVPAPTRALVPVPSRPSSKAALKATEALLAVCASGACSVQDADGNAKAK